MRNGFMAAVLCAFLAGCGGVTSQVQEFVGNDLTTTVDLAQRYGKPEVAKCAAWLQTAMTSSDETLAKIDALSKEKTSGLLSGALKAALMAELIRSLNDPAQQAAMEQAFKANCSAVAGDILINLARDAAKSRLRGL